MRDFGWKTCLATSLWGSLLSEMAFWSSTSVFTSKVPRKIPIHVLLSPSLSPTCFYSLMSCYNSLQFPLQDNYVFQARLVTEETTFVAFREKLYSATSQGYFGEDLVESTVTEQTAAGYAVSTLNQPDNAASEPRATQWVRTQLAPTEMIAGAQNAVFWERAPGIQHHGRRANQKGE